jgi:hypothetical protein
MDIRIDILDDHSSEYGPEFTTEEEILLDELVVRAASGTTALQNIAILHTH